MLFSLTIENLLPTLLPSLLPYLALFELSPVNRYGTFTHNRFQSATYDDPLFIEFNLSDKEMFLSVFRHKCGPFTVQQFHRINLIHTSFLWPKYRYVSR